MKPYTASLLAIGSLASSACAAYVNGGVGGQGRVGGASSSPAFRAAGAVGGSTLGLGRARYGGGVGVRAWLVGEDSVVAGGPEFRSDVALNHAQPVAASQWRLSLATRAFVGGATRYGVDDASYFGSAIDAAVGLSFEEVPEESEYATLRSARPGALQFTASLNLSRIPTLSGGSVWFLGGSIEFSGIFNTRFLLK